MFDRQEIERAGFEEVLRQMPTAVVIAEAPTGKIIFVNKEAQQWTEQVLGQPVPSELEQYRDLQDSSNFKMLHPDGRPYEMQEWPLTRSITSGEEVRDEEIIYRLADGTQLWSRYDFSLIYDDEKCIVAGMAVVYDITEQKRTEEQRAYHAHLLKNIHDAVTATDERFVVTAWNKGAEQMFGWTADEALGRKVYEVIPTDYSDEQLAEALRELSETGRRRSEGLRYRKDGTPVYAEALTIALRGEQGEITGYLGIHRDITERKRAEEELRESEERFRATFEQAAVGIAHTALDGSWLRVNQRLCDIVGYTREELLQKTFQDITHPDDLEADLGQARRLLAAEISSYSMEKRYIKKDGSIVWINLTGSLGRDPSGEPSYFIAVIEDITERKRAEEALRESSSQEKLFAEVEDDGRGFDPAQEPSATTTGGMGIKGMRERARALGGDLKVESEPDKGTKVRFELALEKEREEPEEEEEEEEVRILLVEDHVTVREALASAFEQEEAGLEVVGQAGSLAEARRMCEEAEQEVDVAVIDLALPGGYGGDLIKELREANPQAQALVLSASLDCAEIARAVERGAAGVLHKTAHLDEVVEAVRGLRAGETLLPLEEVVELLRFAGTQREQEYEARQAIEKLTPREKEVLQALAEGLDSEGIAERLHIALRTERNHMASILAKLEVHSQLQALVLALRYGVIEIP